MYWGTTLVEIVRTRFDDGRAACTDGKTIWVDDRLNTAQLKCAIAHELIHIERGHGTRQREEIEMGVRYEAARRLLPLAALVRRCRVGGDLADIAKGLGVTRQVLMDRAVTLTGEQSAEAGCMSCLKCPAQQARMAELPTHRPANLAA